MRSYRTEDRNGDNSLIRNLQEWIVGSYSIRSIRFLPYLLSVVLW